MTSGLDPCTPIGHQQANGTWSEYDCVAGAALPTFVWVGVVIAIVVIALFAMWAAWPRQAHWHIPDIEDAERLR